MIQRGKQLKIGMILSYLSIVINVAAGLIYTPWMISKIGKESYGLYTIATSLITLFLVDFGLSSATARYVSKYRAEGNDEKANLFLGAVYKLYIMLDLVLVIVFTVMFFLLDRIYVNLTPQELEQFRVVYLIAASFSVFNFPFVTFNGILTAHEKFIPLKAADIIQKVLVVGMTVAALLMGKGLYAVVAVNAIAGVIVTVYKFIVVKATTNVKVKLTKTDKGLYKEILSFSIWATVASLAQRLIFTITPSILGIVANSFQASVFGVIATIEQYSYLITGAINGMFMPQISRLYAEGREKEISPLMLKVGKFQYALNGLIVVGFAVVGQAFLQLWLQGDVYTAADRTSMYYGILLVLIPGLFFNSLQIANTALIVVKRVDIQAYVGIVIGIVNVALSFVLSYFYGALGAAASIFVSYMLRAVLLNIIYGKVLKVNIKKFILDCYLRMAVPILIVLAAGLGLNYLLPQVGWIWLVLKAAAVAALYLLLVFSIGITKADRSGFYGFLLRKLGKKKAPVAVAAVEEAPTENADETPQEVEE